MAREAASLLLNCIKSALNESEMTGYKPELLRDAYALAGAHDMAHLMAEALDAAGLMARDDALWPALHRARLAAVFRAEQFAEALATVKRVLSAANIPFIPLKGAVVRDLYPVSWQRTSCDIDVLVEEQNLTAAAEALVAEGGFTMGGKGAHDLSLYSEAKVHIELHYTLVEEHIPTAVQRVLSTVWQYAEKDGAQCTMSPDFFYFYHIAHMAKHFMLGGCGIRPLLDLWIIRQKMSPTDEADTLLEQAGLTTFARAATMLAGVWFGDARHDDVTMRMEDFILRGGVYGTLQNHIAVQRKKKSRLGYIFSKIFLPYEVLKYQYPVIQRHPWLTPLCEVRRWCRLLFGGEWRRVRRTLQVNGGLTRVAVRAAEELFIDLSL